MLRKLRLAVLLYLLAFVGVGTLVESHEATNWDYPLRVVVYPIAGDASPVVAQYVAGLTGEEFEQIEAFFAREAQTHALALERPVDLILAAERGIEVPRPGNDLSRIGIALWSLRVRWLTWLLNWRSDLPAPDITVFAVYHDPAASTMLDRSTALRKGLIAFANVYADPMQAGGNDVVTAHELLHTLGASDKYSFATLQPHYPDGYAEPQLQPLHPQRFAEIMAGRRALSSAAAEMPPSLRSARIGRATAAEIGWPARN